MNIKLYPFNLKNYIAVMIFCFYANFCYSQFTPGIPSDFKERPVTQSPDVANLGRFGEIPVSLFSGQLDLSIPIFSIKNKDIEQPVSIAYSSFGARPDERPGWLGINWTLISGGVIKRYNNGGTDEYEWNNGGHNYFSSKGMLAATNWNTVGFMQNHYSSGKDLSPDEFSFNVNGLSGVFLMDHEGKWIVRCEKDPNMKVECEVTSNYTLINLRGNHNMVLPKVITKFVLTASNGSKYIFGREQKAIEFSMPALHKGVEEYNASGPVGPSRVIVYCRGLDHNPSLPSYACYEVIRNVQASAWNLVQIISPKGNNLNFEYGNYENLSQATYSMIGEEFSFGRRSRTFDINQPQKTLVISSYLKTISTGDGTVCEFSRSVANDLPMQILTKPKSFDVFSLYDYEPVAAVTYKLDEIKLKYRNELIKHVSFKYIENITERLKLKSVLIHSIPEGENPQSYHITYNSKKMPAYNVGQEDHWGFYNGKNFWNGISKQEITALPNLSDYNLSREPDAQYMDAEMISEIKYPTGGYSKFYFEPHSYSKFIDQNPDLILQSLLEDKMAGGLRVKKIEDHDAINSTPVTREYFYAKNYLDGGTLSSGVLASKAQYYSVTESSITNQRYEKFSSVPMGYLNTTNGNHITYSEVTEKKQDGYLVYTYTNHDNGYMDKPAFAKFFNDKQATFEHKLFGKLELERGKIISESYYSSDKSLLKKILNTYNDDPNRYTEYVRAVRMGMIQNCYAYPIYTFNPYLKKKEIFEYFSNGSMLSEHVLIGYDNTGKTIKSVVKRYANNKEEKKILIYPQDYAINANVPLSNRSVYREMVERNMIGSPIEEITSVKESSSEKIVSGELIEYAKNGSNNLILPNKRSTANIPYPLNSFDQSTINTVWDNSIGGYKEVFLKNSRYEEAVNIKYEHSGNVSSYISNGKKIQSFVYGYNGHYPILKIDNAMADEVVYIDVDERGVILEHGTDAMPIMFSGTPDSTFGNCLNMFEMIGYMDLQIQLDADKIYEMTYWDKYSDLDIMDNHTILSEENLQQRGDWVLRCIKFKVPVNTGGLFLISSSGYIKSLLIRPNDTQITTYTHRPLVGITSMTDPKGIIVYYEYDGFGRLKLEKDQYGNIIKNYNYHNKP